MGDPSPWGVTGRVLIVMGAVSLVIGLVLVGLGRIGMLGRLPGDLTIRGRNWSLWIPLASCLLLSVILTLLLNLLHRR
ncbi:MAG: DUF2905 domain-containing protein [Candidatus Zixiibacteriota bacterium]